MKKIFLLIVFLVSLTGFAEARTMRQMFNLMPDSVLPLLTRTNRLDMFDFIDSGMEAQVTNRLGGYTRMTSLTPTTLTLQYTNNTEITMHLFFRQDTVPVVCMIRTAQSGIEDSRVDFYDDRWNHLDASRIISEPVFEDFIDRQYLKDDSVKVLRDMCELMSRKITVSEDGNGLVYSFTGIRYLDEDTDEFGHFLRPDGVGYAWKGRKLRRLK